MPCRKPSYTDGTREDQFSRATGKLYANAGWHSWEGQRVM